MGPLIALRSLAARVPATRVAWLLFGQIAMGLGIALAARAEFGLGVWAVLHDALAKRVGVGLGTADILVGFVVFLAWLPLRVRPGLGTYVSLLLVGFATNASLAVVDPLDGFVPRVAALVAGVAIFAAGVAFYLAAGFGAGPRDGIMTGLHRRFGWSIWSIRVALDGSVLVLGALFGGSVGVGTLAFVLLGGPLIHLTLHVVDRDGRVRRPKSARVVPPAVDMLASNQ